MKANSIVPEDKVVVNNIAHAYKMKGDKENAIKFYKSVLKLVEDDEDWKREIEGEMKKLSK